MKKTISANTADQIRKLYMSVPFRDCGISEWTVIHYGVVFNGLGTEFNPFYLIGKPERITWLLLQL